MADQENATKTDSDNSTGKTNNVQRRDFLKVGTATVAATGLLSAAAMPVHAAQNSSLQMAVVGCGGRGTGAVANALSRKKGQLKLIAMADVFEKNLKNSARNVLEKYRDKPEKVDIPEDRQYVGFGAYKQAMDCLNPATS